MIDINNLPHLNQKKQDELIRKEQQFQVDSTVTGAAVHPQNIDEQMWQEKQNNMSEIRRWMLDLDDKFKKAFEELSGHRFNDSGEKIAIPYIHPIVSINGAFKLINYCKIHDRQVMRSNYSDPRINLNLRYGVGYPLVAIVKELARDGETVRSKATMDYLVHYCFNLVEPIYYHALNDCERKRESEIHKVIETKNVLPDEKKKGIFS